MNQIIKQYQAIKKKYKDAIVLFRVGDCYETFDEDAIHVGKHMKIMVVQLDENAEVKSMASLPFYSLDSALRILTKAGYKVAVCEQLEDPKTTTNSVRRGVIEMRESNGNK